MINLDIYCTTLHHFKILDKLPSYIKPLGLGDNSFPKHWLTEKEGKNISNLNKYYGEMSGIYWIWKNKLKSKNSNDWVGNCHYRKLWLNSLYEKKQKSSLNSLYQMLLNQKNEIFNKCDAIQVQPIILKKETVYEQFSKVHEKKIMENCVNLLPAEQKNKFMNFLNGNKLCGLNMFITKTYIYKEYCENVFPWMEKCLNYCLDNNLGKGYNIRLPAFLAERYTSFWFLEFTNTKFLSYARLGNFMLSNKINSYINPTKIPLTFRMYPTLHDY